ncbi:dihydrofolate reductase family protein [Glutamicibacter sp. MNS18]|uniref:dihydrofolate reductase family protein n=1 Tax=Glutamicibacter sp. MNS18 TaxID=2989817 RepID=UPI002235B688|nr:dihydrofolate reductase family protein [Glutamicibacter sp. MNS18]MCW4466259.1 dihydrofolate reductase family protein [Glutamicibacter sp. MNS18]
MRTLIVTAFISLDGVAEAPGGEEGYRNTGWTFTEVEHLDAVYELKASEQSESTGMLLGRKSYDSFSAVWPDMDEEFADYNDQPKFVVSSTLQERDLHPGWGQTSILRSMADVARLRASDGGPITVHGSLELVHCLQEHKLVDRYHLLVFPLLLGEGRRLFSSAELPTQKLDLVESESYANGVQKMVFDVVR